MMIMSPNWLTKFFWFDFHSTKGYWFIQVNRVWVRYERHKGYSAIEYGRISK